MGNRELYQTVCKTDDYNISTMKKQKDVTHKTQIFQEAQKTKI